MAKLQSKFQNLNSKVNKGRQKFCFQYLSIVEFLDFEQRVGSFPLIFGPGFPYHQSLSAQRDDLLQFILDFLLAATLGLFTELCILRTVVLEVFTDRFYSLLKRLLTEVWGIKYLYWKIMHWWVYWQILNYQVFWGASQTEPLIKLLFIFTVLFIRYWGYWCNFHHITGLPWQVTMPHQKLRSEGHLFKSCCSLPWAGIPP